VQLDNGGKDSGSGRGGLSARVNELHITRRLSPQVVVVALDPRLSDCKYSGGTRNDIRY
jgi:hypothetical protein